MAIADQTTSTNSQHQDQERSWHLRAPDVEAVELLYHPGGSVQSFPLPGRADDLQLLPGGELLLELLVHLLGQLGEVLGLVLDEAESVLGQRVQHVQAVNLVALQIFNARILCLLRIHILFSFSIFLLFIWRLYFLKSRTLAIGRSKETMARVFGLGIPRGGSKLPMKSDIWLNVMNCVACGSNLKQLHYYDLLRGMDGAQDYFIWCQCLNCIVRCQDQEIKEWIWDGIANLLHRPSLQFEHTSWRNKGWGLTWTICHRTSRGPPPRFQSPPPTNNCRDPQN